MRLPARKMEVDEKGLLSIFKHTVLDLKAGQKKKKSLKPTNIAFPVQMY